jgi:hypothetical protein
MLGLYMKYKGQMKRKYLLGESRAQYQNLQVDILDPTFNPSMSG